MVERAHGNDDGHEDRGHEDRRHQDREHADRGPEAPPGVARLRDEVRSARAQISTGWPVLDRLTGGIPLARGTVVRGPSQLRLQVLARMAAWAAGDGWPVLIASRTLTESELRLAVAAGGLGLPAAALLDDDRYDHWLDARLRVLDLRVIGGRDAHLRAGEEVAARTPALLIVDDYLMSEVAWQMLLDPRDQELDLLAWPRHHRCALVLGDPGMDRWSWTLDRADLNIRLVPREREPQVRISAYRGPQGQSAEVPLRHGYLDAPIPSSALVRRAGVTNLWQDSPEQDVEGFAGALGVDSDQLFWQPDEGA